MSFAHSDTSEKEPSSREEAKADLNAFFGSQKGRVLEMPSDRDESSTEKQSQEIPCSCCILS